MPVKCPRLILRMGSMIGYQKQQSGCSSQPFAASRPISEYLGEPHSINALASARIRFQSFVSLPISTVSTMFGGFNGRSGNTGVFRGPPREPRKPQAAARTVAAAGALRPVYARTARATNGQTGISVPGPMPESPGMSGHDVAAVAATNVPAPGGNTQLPQAAYYRSPGLESANGQPGMADEQDFASLHIKVAAMSGQVAYQSGQVTCMLEYMQDLKNGMNELKAQMNELRDQAQAALHDAHGGFGKIMEKIEQWTREVEHWGQTYLPEQTSQAADPAWFGQEQ
ncbi:uncharacterized protein B0T15DRAFT_537691 [Chaetomium strumarium]|uniref:Uncharacterized protein n=1 Tax=Chaetomium strumarium TaxID=1170767 RepID=A0AAJ0M0U5_9PEZI|nr:hypothetical protein B0T15DRAFT_537691 [Chaetomium strumarium]